MPIRNTFAAHTVQSLQCAATEIGYGADLLSHEATFSRGMAAKARIAKHSTAEMAGRFARQLNAQTLVLTHFSGRYSDRGPATSVARALTAFCKAGILGFDVYKCIFSDPK